MAMTTFQPSALALAEAAAAIFLASASDRVLCVSMEVLKGLALRLVFAAAGMQDEFSVAVGLFAALEDQVAGGGEREAVLQRGRHRQITGVAGVLLVDHRGHARQRVA